MWKRFENNRKRPEIESIVDAWALALKIDAIRIICCFLINRSQTSPRLLPRKRLELWSKQIRNCFQCALELPQDRHENDSTGKAFQTWLESKRTIRNRLDRVLDIFGFPHILGIDLKIGMKTNWHLRFITKLNVGSSQNSLHNLLYFEPPANR